MLQPRFAINKFGAVGIVIIAMGGALAGGVIDDLLPPSIGWLIGGTLAALGLAAGVLAGRWGSFRDSKRLLNNGTRTQAKVIDKQALLTSTTGGEHGPTQQSGAIFRIDLRLLDTGHEVRVHRSVNYGRHSMFLVLDQLEVAYDPADPRRVAIDWDKIPSPEAYAQQQMVAAQTQMAAVQASFTAGAHTPATHAPTEQATILSAKQIAHGTHGEPVLELVVELTGKKYARGTVGGPPGRLPQPGETLGVQLDATRTSVVGVNW